MTVCVIDHCNIRFYGVIASFSHIRLVETLQSCDNLVCHLNNKLAIIKIRKLICLTLVTKEDNRLSELFGSFAFFIIFGQDFNIKIMKLSRYFIQLQSMSNGFLYIIYVIYRQVTLLKPQHYKPLLYLSVCMSNRKYAALFQSSWVYLAI